MNLRTKIQVMLTLLSATGALLWSAHASSHPWLPFFFLLVAVLLSSGMKVSLPSGEGSMSATFPFILLGLVELSSFQAILLTGISVAVQCRLPERKPLAVVQSSFNVGSAMLATALAYFSFAALQRFHMVTAPALAIAAVVYFLANTGSVAAIIASSKGENTLALWRREFTWYLPFYMVGAAMAATANYLATHFGWATALLLIPAVYTLYRAYIGQLTQLKERQQHLEETEALHVRTIEGLAMAIEAKDQGTHDHLFRVRNYVQAVGKALHLSELEMKALQTASFLHDIGKLAVPEHIINKPGKLTPEEFEKMKIHPGVGADILERVRFPYPVVPIVRSHHEWWNGTGYPDGLKGEDIPIGARVLTVVDCFDALVSDRPYRKGMTSQKALSIIRDLSGKQFDPKIVELFEHCHAESELQSEALVESVFSPLNTDLEITRGIAPGAGFEAGSGESAAVIDAQSAERTGEFGASPQVLGLLAGATHDAQTLFEISQTLGQSLTAEELAGLIFSRVLRLVPSDACALFVRKGDSIHVQYVEGDRARQFTAPVMAVGEGISGWVAQSGKAILNGNATMEPGCPAGPDGALAFRAALSIPLLDLQKQPFAVLTCYSTRGDAFSRDHLRVLQTMEGKLSLALRHTLGLARPAASETGDPVTGLPGARELFLQLEAELHVCRTTDTRLTVAVCDLNAFKEVNARRGQAAGDRVLGLVAENLRRAGAGRDMVARMGGDEFVVVLPGVSEKQAACRTDEIREAIASTSKRMPQGVGVTASVGVAFYPADGTTAEDLLAAADRRMYLDKQKFYSANTSAAAGPRAAATA